MANPQYYRETAFAPGTGPLAKVVLGTTYLLTWNAVNATFAGPGQVKVGQSKQGGVDFSIWRGALIFDTSYLGLLGPNINIQSARIHFVAETVSKGDGDFVMTIQNGQPLYPHNPMVNADYQRTLYSGNGGSLSTVGIIDGSDVDIDLNATGLTWINTAGDTKLMLRTAEDINGVEPGNNHENSLKSTVAALEFNVGYIGPPHPSFSAPLNRSALNVGELGRR